MKFWLVFAATFVRLVIGSCHAFTYSVKCFFLILGHTMTRKKSKLDLNKKKRKRDQSKSNESDELQRSNLSEQGKSPSTSPKRKELKVTETGASAWSLLETATLFTNSRALNKTCTNANELTISKSISNQLNEEREKITSTMN